MSVQAISSRLPGGNAPQAIASGFDVEKLRADFPILREAVNGRPLVYLDNAATSQKPESVIQALVHYYRHDNANIHRGVHLLSQRATEEYEAARGKVQGFLGAPGGARDYVCARRHGSHQPGGADLRPRAHRRRRRSIDHRHGTPLQHCAVADPLPGEGRDVVCGAHQRSRRIGDRRIRKVAGSTNKDGLGGARVERAGNYQSGANGLSDWRTR